MMDNLMDFLRSLAKITKSEYFALTTFILAIISIVLAYIFYRKGRKTIRLIHSLTSYALIENNKSKFPRLKIFYDDMNLDNFSIAQLIIKNFSNTSIKADDIAPSDPIKLTIDGEAEILEAEIIYQKDKTNNFQINKIDKNTILIKFDFIDPKDETSIQIYHTGFSQADLKISGSIIGEDKPFSEEGKKRFQISYLSFNTNMLKFIIDPKLKWVRVLLDFIIGIGLISYAFLCKPAILSWLLLIIIGIGSLITSIRRIFKKENLSIERMKSLEYLGDAASHNISKRLQSVLKDINKTKP